MGMNGGAMDAILSRINELKAHNPHVIVAIDGGAGSGKSSLAEKLGAILQADVLHMDDYFLQPHQRTAERFAQPGGNVDRERFLEEALLPLSRGEAYTCRRFACSTQTLGEGVIRAPGAVTIVEGSYSLHPELEAFYDLRILLTIDARKQSERILAREGAEKHRRFMQEWIPMENRYFEHTQITRRCDLCVNALELEEQA